MTTEDACKFLRDMAQYFVSRPTNGEDMAFWSNVQNAESCHKIIVLLKNGTVEAAAP